MANSWQLTHCFWWNRLVGVCVLQCLTLRAVLNSPLLSSYPRIHFLLSSKPRWELVYLPVGQCCTGIYVRHTSLRCCLSVTTFYAYNSLFNCPMTSQMWCFNYGNVQYKANYSKLSNNTQSKKKGYCSKAYLCWEITEFKCYPGTFCLYKQVSSQLLD